MFSTRCLAILALVAAVSALPVEEKPIPKPITTITNDDIVPAMPAPWFNVPFFGDITKLFAPLWKLFPSFEDLGPSIIADDDKFQVVVQVKDYKKEDLKVKVKRDFIFVQGTQETKQDDHDLLASHFFHTYTMPANSSLSDVTAKLTNDGYLIVNAPITGHVERSRETERDVPIEETGAPYKREEIPEPAPIEPEVTRVEPEITTTVPEIATEDDRKEPTTPSNEEDATEKDNVIPHGNEVTP